MRLSRSSAFRCAVHLRSPIDSPARLTTASASSTTAVSAAEASSRPSGAQPTLVTPGMPVPDSCRASPGLSLRVSTRTSCPSSAYTSASGLPRNPDPPEMTIFIPGLDARPRLQVCGADRVLQGASRCFEVLQGARCSGAVVGNVAPDSTQHLDAL